MSFRWVWAHWALGVGLSFSSTVWAFEFVDFSAFSCLASGLATLGRLVWGDGEARLTLVVFQVGLSAETFSAGFRFAVAHILVGDGKAR